MIKAILWDNDGVLVDTEKLYFSATRETMAEVGFNLTDELFREYFLNAATGTWHLLSALGVTETEIVRLKEKRHKKYEELLSAGNHLFPQIKPMLEKLGRVFRMAVVTSSDPNHFKLIHASTGILENFEFVLTRDCYQLAKPDPEPYLLASSKLNLKPEQCLVIEDSQRGLRSAKGAGMRCWIIKNELSRGGNFSEADEILTNLGELEAKIEKLLLGL